MSDICLYDVSAYISSRFDTLKSVIIDPQPLCIFLVTNRYFKFHPMKKSLWRDLPKTSSNKSLKSYCETNRNPQAEFRDWNIVMESSHKDT